MATLMDLIKSRQGNRSNEQYANVLGLTGVTYWRYLTGESVMTQNAVKKMVPYFKEHCDSEMLGALAVFSLGLDLSCMVDKIEEIGSIILSE